MHQSSARPSTALRHPARFFAQNRPMLNPGVPRAASASETGTRAARRDREALQPEGPRSKL